MLIKLKNLCKTYQIGKVDIHALNSVNLEITEGDFVSIAGPSGSGKTTLLNIIGLIDSFDSGELFIDSIEIKNQDRHELTRLRSTLIGFIFQSFNLLPVLNVFENVELPLIISPKKYSKPERRDKVNYLLQEVGLAHRAKHTPAELSGGEQQRVAIARALVTSPRIVIADEPTGNLDSNNGEKILTLMRNINKTDKTTFIFSTHDAKIWNMADHIVFLQNGTIKEDKRI